MGIRMPSLPSMSDELYANVRDLLGRFIGCRLVDVTQQDRDEFDERGAFVTLMFDNGETVEFPIGEDGFHFETLED